MKYLYLILLMVCVCIGGFSQDKTAGDYYKHISVARTDTEKVKWYIGLADLYSVDNPDSSMALSFRALALAKSAGDPVWLCKAQMSTGISYQKQSKYKEASAYFFEGLKTAEKTGNNNLKGSLFNSVATVLSNMKEYTMAEVYYHKAYDCFKSTGNESRSALVLTNLGGIVYLREYPTGHFSECFKYYNEAVRIGEETHDDGILATAYGNLVLVYNDAGKYAEALKVLDKAMKLAERTSSKENTMFLNYYAGKTYFGLKDFEKAKSYLLESTRLAEEMKNSDNLSEDYLSLSEVHYAEGDYKGAYDYFEKYKQLEDTLMSQGNTQQLNELKTIYETEKKEKALELSNEKLESQAGRLRNQQIVIFSSIGGGLLLLVLVLVLYNRSQIKQKANNKLSIAYATIEEKNKDITDSINYAQKIQEAILPDEHELGKSFTEIFVLLKPRDVVSGDFYWFYETPERKYIAAADCTGHGVPGAMMSMIGSSLLNQVVVEKHVTGTGEILDALREGVKNAFKQREGKGKQRDGMDIALLGFSKDMRQAQFSGANNGLYHISSGVLKEYSGNKQPIGQHEGTETPFTTAEIALSPGDCLYLYSDGYADQFGGEKGKKFKYAQLKSLLLEIHALPLHEQKEQLAKAFIDWKRHHEQIDDVLIIGIKA